MSLRRELVASLSLQGAGAAAVLLAVLLLGARLGPDVQGGFSHIKSEVEFAAAFAMFGLPQALFFHVKAGSLSLRAALRWACGSALFALPLVALCERLSGQSASAWAPMALAAAMVVLHGQLRALLLVRERTAWFNVLTALPQVLVLTGVVVFVWRGQAEPRHWFIVFAVAHAIAAALAWWRLRLAADRPVETEAGWQALGSYGAAAWLTAALATAAVVLVQRWVEMLHGAAALGRFTMVMTLTQVPLTPISYAAPLLFRRWMERPGRAASQRIAGFAAAFMLTAAALVFLASLAWPDLGLGRAYSGATLALAVILLGGAAEAASRVLAVQASARGTPRIAVYAEISRSAVLGLGWLLCAMPALLSVCALWTVAAWTATGVFIWFARVDARAEQA